MTDSWTANNPDVRADLERVEGKLRMTRELGGTAMWHGCDDIEGGIIVTTLPSATTPIANIIKECEAACRDGDTEYAEGLAYSIAAFLPCGYSVEQVLGQIDRRIVVKGQSGGIERHVERLREQRLKVIMASDRRGRGLLAAEGRKTRGRAKQRT